MSLLYASTCFEHYVLITRSKLYYTASGIITPVGGRPVRRLREEWFFSQLVHFLFQTILNRKRVKQMFAYPDSVTGFI